MSSDEEVVTIGVDGVGAGAGAGTGAGAGRHGRSGKGKVGEKRQRVAGERGSMGVGNDVIVIED